MKSRMILQVHDELVLDVPENEVEHVTRMVRREMDGVYALDVPLIVDVHVGSNWAEAH